MRVGYPDTQIFGTGTVEYNRYSPAAHPDRGPWNYAYEVSLGEIREGFVRGKAEALALLGQAVASFEERLADSGASDTGRTLRAYEGLDLHPEIETAVGRLYRDGHYANAVEDAVKALNAFVRMRSGEEIDGATLMEKVFSPNNPILRFNEMKNQPDRDEQKGFTMMFSGAVAGLRNPRAHKLIKDDDERALKFIAFVSLLAKLLENAKK